MFEWKVEDMVLLNQKDGKFLGKEKIYDCESRVSREDKIAFVDSFQEGKLSYILALTEKFNEERETMPKDQFGHVKTVSLKSWIKRNDTKYNRPILDDHYKHGEYFLLGSYRNIKYNNKGSWDTYDDFVDEMFHRQLKKCEEEENVYFHNHDEYSILKSTFREKMDKYGTTFGVPIVVGGGVFVGDFEKYREITIDELKDMLSKYEQLDIAIEKLTAEIHIVY